MKKVYLLFVAVILAACSAEPVENEVLSGLDANLEGKKNSPVILLEASEPLASHTFMSGNSENEKARLDVSNDCDGVYLNFTSLNEEDIEVKFDVFSTLPILDANHGNGKETLPKDAIKFDEADLDANGNYFYSYEILNVSSNDNIYVFARMGNDYAGEEEHGDWEYFTYVISEVNCNEPVCESGYMIGDKDFDEIGTSNNWGWAHQFNFTENGSETREIHHKNGSLGGEVTISYNNENITVTEGEGVTITHMYISNDEPTKTNAPGQFDKEQTYSDSDGTFWVMIKAEVCE